MRKKSTIQDPGDAIRANAPRQELGWATDRGSGTAGGPPISPPEVLSPSRPGMAGRSIPALRLQASPRQRPATAPAAAPDPVVRSPYPPVAHTAPVIPSPPRVQKPRKRRSRQGWSLALLLFIGAVMTGGVGLVSLVWLTRLPPAADCERVSALSPDAEQLYCAREAAQTGDIESIRAALELVQSWDDRHPLYTESQKLVERWSRSLLDIAQQRYGNSDLKGAIDVASYVPASSPLYAEAQDTIAAWQGEWQQGEDVLAIAQTALQQRDWDTASEQLLALGQMESSYWREQQVATLTAQIVAERNAWAALEDARKLMRQPSANTLQQAIAKIDTINSQTYVWQDAQAELQGWGNALAAQGLQAWQEGDTQAALAVAQSLPPDLPLEGEARYLMQLGHAQSLAQWDIHANWQPSIAQMWRLQEAIAALQTIPPSSAFYAPAQANIEQWQAQWADLGQLQWASAIASLGSRSALEVAQYQASQLGLDRPRRLQAQTLMAHWAQQVDRLQDMPLFRRAEAIAAAADIPALQRAIALLQRIPDGRALFADAQGAIATWTAKIQTIEDQPLLDQAQALAKDGKLAEAVRTARRIQAGRALHAQAQELANTWQAEIDRVLIAEDRRILDEAVGLAAEGSLSRAIDVAAQIGGDRPLYGEARAAIRQWEAERNAVWQQWEAEETPVYEDPGYAPDPAYSPDGASYYDDYAAPSSDY